MRKKPPHNSSLVQDLSSPMVKIASAICLLLLMGCVGSAPTTRQAAKSVSEISGSKGERVARVSRILAKHQLPATKIIDAHLLEAQIGDGVLGPSDWRSFVAIEISPQDVKQWTKLLTPLSGKVEYVRPPEHRDWWVAKTAFASLQLYEPLPLTGRIHGWVGVSPQTGRIYIFTFTS